MQYLGLPNNRIKTFTGEFPALPISFPRGPSVLTAGQSNVGLSVTLSVVVNTVF
jgi:hypothetical protein